MKWPLLSAFAACLILSSCSSEPPKPKEPEKPPEPVTGRHALQQMFIAARTWAQDLQIVSMTSLHLSKAAAVPGKADGWQVMFASPNLQQQRAYTWSASEISMSIHKGVTDERAQPLSSGTKMFPIAAVKIDSDEAYQVALKKEAKYAEAHPDMPITYQLQMNQNVPDAVWRIIWGESSATSSNSVLVDASTGQYMGTLH